MSVLEVLSSVRSLMCLGRVIQREGAATEKALSPQVRCLVLGGGVRKFASEERRVWDGLCMYAGRFRLKLLINALNVNVAVNTQGS